MSFAITLLMLNLPTAGLGNRVKRLVWPPENRVYNFIFLPAIQGGTQVIAVVQLDPDHIQTGQRSKETLKQNSGVRSQHMEIS